MKLSQRKVKMSLIVTQMDYLSILTNILPKINMNLHIIFYLGCGSESDQAEIKQLMSYDYEIIENDYLLLL